MYETKHEQNRIENKTKRAERRQEISTKYTFIWSMCEDVAMWVNVC